MYCTSPQVDRVASLKDFSHCRALVFVVSSGEDNPNLVRILAAYLQGPAVPTRPILLAYVPSFANFVKADS